MSNTLSALRNSVERLRSVVGGLGPGQVRQPAYPAEWTIADTLSHIGSGAVILRRRLEDAVRGGEVDASFSQAVWDEWNAKGPDAQAADALIADRALLDGFESLDDTQRAAFHLAMGPFDLDFTGFVGLRLNEHVLHTWDIEVMADPDAVLPSDASQAILGTLGMIVGLAGKPVGHERTVQVATTAPDRAVTVALGTDSVTMTVSEPANERDLEIPAEAFIRLVYGRLDPRHTPSTVDGPLLDELRTAFPGL